MPHRADTLRDHLRHLLRRRGVAAAADADLAVDDDHADAGDVALAHAVEQVLAGGVLGPVHDHEVGGVTGYSAATSLMTGRLPVALA